MSESPIRYWQSMTTVEADGLGESDPVVILPLAAIEQHGPHLPLSTDLDIGMGLIKSAFRYLPANFPAWVLPPQTVGCSTEHVSFSGTLSIEPELLSEMIYAHGVALARCGVKRFLVSNSHGGNRHAVDAAGLRLRKEKGLLVVKSHYFLFPRTESVNLPDAEWSEGLHGGAVETAMMLHLCPNMVRTQRPQPAPFLGDELKHEMRHLSPENMSASFSWLVEDLNDSGVIGNATLADAIMGQRLVDSYGKALAEVIRDTKEFPIARLE